ncbi:hypothetical protein [Streptomyces sp. NK08204]|uniref:hypothetical protein n=1 Tax=Streptomyces sp. NK08204 TaxID=2873260 RepID=UPI001CECCFC1|nr:hypothetical protein [Streptomyces sp. NK08204]
MAEAYPTPLAGQRITASLLRAMQPQVARKTADTSLAATTTLTSDPHLTFDVTAGAVYAMDGIIKYDGPAAADLNMGWSVPAGALGEWYGWGVGHSPVISTSNTPALVTDTQTSRGYTVRTETNDVAQPRSFGCLGVSLTPLTVQVWGMLRVGATGGTYALQWAQNTSDASAVTLYTDSWLRLQRIA